MKNTTTDESRNDWSVDPDEPLGPQVYRILRERIIRNDLSPGVRVSEEELAQLYCISRQPVREAFVKLEDQRLVEVRPKRATRVRRISMQAVMDARFVREAVESDVVRVVARHPGQAIINELGRQIRRQRRSPRRNLSRFMELDEAFHRMLAEAAGHTDAWHFLESIKAQMDRVRYLSLHRFPATVLIDQHEAIVEAIAARSPDRAERAMRKHLQGILDDLPTIVADFPELFSHEFAENSDDDESAPTKQVAAMEVAPGLPPTRP